MTKLDVKYFFLKLKIKGIMVTSMLDSTSVDRAKIHEWITLWGSSTSEVILDAKCQLFFTPGIEGFIGYRIEKDSAVVFCDPVCEKKNTAHLAEAFQEFCEKNEIPIIYLLASEQFANWAINSSCKVMIEVCEELIFDPQIDPTIGSKAHRLRNKINHTHTLNLSVEEYLQYDRKIELAMQQVGTQWLKDRKGPQIHLGPLLIFEDRTDKRWFYVKDKDNFIISVGLLRKLDSQNGWFLKFLLTTPSAPRGTSELLMNAMLETLRKENCHYLSVGMVPAPSLGIIHGLSKFYKSLARNFFTIAKWVFNLEHRKIYWEQFHPSSKRSFILFTKPSIGIRDVRAIMKSLNVNV